MYSTGSGNLIAPEFDVFKRGRWGCLPKELSLVAVWKEPSVFGAEPNEKPVSESVVTKKSSVSEREIFVSCTHQTGLAKEYVTYQGWSSVHRLPQI
jgi:hypothetical protein